MYNLYIYCFNNPINDLKISNKIKDKLLNETYDTNPNYHKPIFNSEEPVCVTMSFASSLIWDVEIEPGMEIEKTVNFSIMNVRKEKKDFKLN